MKKLHTISWNEVFSGWRDREATNPGWIHCATEIKGWPDWESWRKYSAEQMKAPQREWVVYEFTDPKKEIPEMLLGPYSGWQSRCPEPHSYTFQDLLSQPEQYQFFAEHDGVKKIMNGLPFDTELIGLTREDNGKIICIEGHHRATAITLAAMEGKDIDYSSTTITITLAVLKQNELDLLDKALSLGSKNPQK